ncbi:MAG: cytidylate kinase-like family protein [Eubacteriales bacterium]|nr:cytidylate kinase-like family protein [Eubacteriales bacterium]
MDNVVITIARQYGSGGRTVGEMLSKKLGISYYDKNIIRMASDDSGIHEELFGRVDEYNSAKPPLFKKSSVYTGELVPPSSKDFLSDENLFSYQAKVIRELAEKESCVIIGRCSNYILKDYPNVLSVFIHASWDYRIQEASKKLGGTTKEVEKYLQKDDKRKFEFCRRFTGQEWTDATNYDLCLDSSKLGYEMCIEEIEHRLKMMKR